MCNGVTITQACEDAALMRDYTRLYNTVDSFDNPEHIELPTEYFQSSFSYPTVNLSEDFILVRNDVGELIASGTIFTENNASHTSRLMIQVHPDYRCQGIGTEILNHLMQVGLQRGSFEFVCRVPSYRSYAATFVEKHGFSHDYTWMKMQIELGNPPPVFSHPIGLTVRALNVKKELAIWADLQNTIFKGFPGYEAVSTKDLGATIKHITFDSSLLVIGTYFSQPIGYCLGFSVESASKEKILRIEGMGVLPEFRRRGYACAIVSEILKRAYIKQHVSSELVVRSSNSSAIGLYEKCGFREVYKHLWYKKAVPHRKEGRDEIG